MLKIHLWGLARTRFFLPHMDYSRQARHFRKIEIEATNDFHVIDVPIDHPTLRMFRRRRDLNQRFKLRERLHKQMRVGIGFSARTALHNRNTARNASYFFDFAVCNPL